MNFLLQSKKNERSPMCFDKFLWRFYRSESGFLLSTESLLLGTIGVLGSIVGLAEIRNAVVEELGDFSHAVAMLSQDYAYTSVESSNVAGDIQTAGSFYDDAEDTQSLVGTEANGILVATPGDVE